MDHKEYLSETDKEAIAEPVIQRFETCYDTLWKILKRYLNEELGLPDVPDSPKPVFRIAAENNMFTADVSQWIKYADARIAASHDCSGEKAGSALKLMNSLIKDSIDLYTEMTSEPWEKNRHNSHRFENHKGFT